MIGDTVYEIMGLGEDRPLTNDTATEDTVAEDTTPDEEYLVYTESDVDDIIDTLIDDIEKAKSRVVIEADDLKEDYHAGTYRKHGLTKRQCEDRMFKRSGEVFGYEGALSVLYRLKAARDNG